jgi:hypothetical protein
MCAHLAGGNIVGMIEIGELSKQDGHDVFRVLRPRRGLATVLTGMGATVLAEPRCGLWVTGMDPCRIALRGALRTAPRTDAKWCIPENTP